MSEARLSVRKKSCVPPSVGGDFFSVTESLDESREESKKSFTAVNSNFQNLCQNKTATRAVFFVLISGFHPQAIET